jgi:glutamate synthase domain-containing protein 1/glutamate synthase domain-containing protein 3
MIERAVIENLIQSRESLVPTRSSESWLRKAEAEGGCGVIGIACDDKIAGRHLLQALKQMRNRGNGKGGGIAAVGLVPQELGVSQEVLQNDYLLTIAYLEANARPEVERGYIDSIFEIDHVRSVPHGEELSSNPRPPEVVQYFVRVRPEASARFLESNRLPASALSPASVADEIVYQNSYRLNHTYYASAGEKRAFVLSSGKNLVVLKMVGYGDDVIRHYRLEDFHAHVWIGHHRYPTKGKVWHPGGAHPFVALHEALVHNGDFANYASICEYLAQRNIRPLFLTDTEVSVLVFDLLHRTYGYPLEYVIEALAPTTERDFTLLPEDKQQIYRMLQTVHIHGSPDGPWFFLIAQSAQAERAYRLIGVTDTSMLRPQVFALQQGSRSIGFAASEKQAIDAALESLASEDRRFWTHADLYWNARGGSHTDGGAFIFTIQSEKGGSARLACTDKFGRPIQADASRHPYGIGAVETKASTQVSAQNRGTNLGHQATAPPDVPPDQLFAWVREQLVSWDYDDLLAFLKWLEKSAKTDAYRKRAFEVLTLLMDLRYPTGVMRRSCLLTLLDQSLATIVESIRQSPSGTYAFVSAQMPSPTFSGDPQTVIIDARDFAPEGAGSLALEIVRLYGLGFRRMIVFHAKGHRFIANGLGPGTRGVRIDVYGSSGDYLASGIDGAEVFVHGNAQDQVAQIMKDGKLVIYGDVGQTFLYAAKGGQAFVLGNAAGRPLINAVGHPRVVINGTCLDYLAESFMAGDPLSGGGFVIVNGVRFNNDGVIVELDTPYPGGNLFSLASGGAVYIRDPHGKVSDDQLNGGEFAPLEERDWAVIRPYLEENERLFGISVSKLLEVEGKVLPANQVYRKIRPRATGVLQAEEAWVRMHT